MADCTLRKRILLINPPGKVHVFSDGTPAHRKHCTPPLGLAYIASNLKQNGYEVHAMDMLAEGYNNELLKESSIVYGLSADDMVDRIDRVRPDIIGISVLFSFVINDVYDLCRAIKAQYPQIPVVLGGHHPSAVPDEVMQCDAVDFVLVSEADVNFVLLVDSLNGRLPLHEVPNLYYRDNGEIRNTRSNIMPSVKGSGWNYYNRKNAGVPIHLDQLPFPSWDIFPMHAYWSADVRIGGGDVVRSRFAVMLGSRGCPHACYFCSSALMSGYRGYRMRNNDEILREIRWLVGQYGVEEILFLDDNFFAGKPKIKRLLKKLSAEFPDTLFSATGGTEVNALDHEMIDLMAAANFYKVQMAVEAGDQNVQNSLIDKKVNVSRVPEVVAYMKQKGIEVRALYMIGFPGETREQIQRTIDLAKNLDLDDFYISIVTPIPGTPLYDECIEKGLFIDGFDLNDIRYSAAKIRLPDTTPEELEQIRREVWLESFEQKRSNLKTMVNDRRRKYVTIEEYEDVGFRSLRGIPGQKEKAHI